MTAASSVVPSAHTTDGLALARDDSPGHEDAAPFADVIALHEDPIEPAGPIEPVASFPLGIDRRADWHTHSNLSVGAASALTLADAAQAAGLRRLGLSDRVTAASGWLDDYRQLIRAFERPGLTVMCAVETTVLDLAGGLDLPRALPFLDYAIVTVDAIPTPRGLVPLDEVRRLLADGAMTGEQVIDTLVTATAAAVRACPARPVVGRLFSPLRALEVGAEVVTRDHVEAIAAACRDAGGAVEINERWQAPTPEVATALAAAGVTLVAGSSAMTPDGVGAWDYLDTITGTESADLAEVVDIDNFARPYDENHLSEPTSPSTTELAV